MYRLAELKRLSQAYIDATGISVWDLSESILGPQNNRSIGRLIDGRGISGSSAEVISDFFDREWPANVPWPADIARNGAKQSEAAE